MSHSAMHYGTPHAGDQVWISPAAGIHGQGSWWALVVSTTPALTKGAIYLRVVPLADVDGDAKVRVFYARSDGLLIRRCG